MSSSQGTTTNNTAAMSDDDDDVAFDCCDTDDVNNGRINRSVKTMLPYLPMFDDDEESFCSDECDENQNQNQNQNKFIGGNEANEGSGIHVSSYLSQPPPGVVVVLDGSPLFPYQDADTNEENNYKMSINFVNNNNNNNNTDDNNKSSNNTINRLAINRTLSFDDVDFDDVDCDCDYDDDDDDEEDDIQHQEECGLSFTIPITGTSSGGRNHSNFLYHVS
jgi:hypothetical protein